MATTPQEHWANIKAGLAGEGQEPRDATPKSKTKFKVLGVWNQASHTYPTINGNVTVNTGDYVIENVNTGEVVPITESELSAEYDVEDVDVEETTTNKAEVKGGSGKTAAVKA